MQGNGQIAHTFERSGQDATLPLVPDLLGGAVLHHCRCLAKHNGFIGSFFNAKRTQLALGCLQIMVKEIISQVDQIIGMFPPRQGNLFGGCSINGH